MGWHSARELELSTGMTQFLSVAGGHELAAVSAKLAESAATRTMILSIGAPDLGVAIDAAREWTSVLEANPEVARVRSGPDDAFARTVFELYFPRRFLFLSPRPESELPERFSSAGLRLAARHLRDELSLPEVQLTKQIAGADPLLAFPDLLRRFEAAWLGGLGVRDGHFVAADRSTAILFVTTVHSAFDASRQGPFTEFLEQSFAELDRRFAGVLVLERSAVHRFAVASERRARAEMTRISGISLAGIVVLFLLVFPSVHLLAISLLPLVAGVLTAISVGTVLFGQLHLTTLVFGSTLIGVCIDYPIHYITHYTLLPAEGSQGSLRRIWVALTMGALTTVAGFAVLACSDLPGIREIGVFSGLGVLAALLTTGAMLPPLAPRRPRAGRLQRALADALERLLVRMERHRSSLVAIPLLALIVCGAGLPRASWRDDVFALNAPLDAGWIDEGARVRARVSQMDAGRIVVALAPDLESALRLNDAAAGRLAAAREAGLIDGYRSLHAFLWSAELQRRNLAALAAFPDLPEHLAAALDSEGFRPAVFAPFTDSLSETSPEPLRLEDLLDSPLAELVASFHIELDDGVALLTFLRGVRDPIGLEAALSGLPGVRYFDQQRFLEQVYGSYRKQTSALILGGLLAVLVLLRIRYHSARLCLAAATPPLLGAATTLAVLSLAGTPIGLLHLLGLLLVLSLGVDYSVFLLESRHDEALPAALLSVSIACVTTCLAFGLLAASSFPALRALGLTTGLGVVSSLILAPASLVLAGRPRSVG